MPWLQLTTRTQLWQQDTPHLQAWPCMRLVDAKHLSSQVAPVVSPAVQAACGGSARTQRLHTLPSRALSLQQTPMQRSRQRAGGL